MNYLLLRLATLSALVLLATACVKNNTTPAVDNSNDNLLLSNPSGVVASTNSPTNYLLVKPQYAVGYHRDQSKAG